jgi:hypothetical protein
MQVVYQRWVGLNKCSAHALIEDDAKDVAVCIRVPLDERECSTTERLMKYQYNILTRMDNGRSGAQRTSVVYREMKVRRVFAGEAICIGLNLDLTLDEEQMRQEFRKPSNISSLSERNYLNELLETLDRSRERSDFDRSRERSYLDQYDSLKGWCNLRDSFFEDRPEILTELTVHLAKKVQEVGTLRAFLDCTTASVDKPNIRGTIKRTCIAVVVGIAVLISYECKILDSSSSLSPLF